MIDNFRCGYRRKAGKFCTKGEIVLGNTYDFAIFGKKFGKKCADKRYR